jgi:hypothetical protein
LTRIPPTGSSRRQCQPRRQRRTDLDTAWPNNVAIVPALMKRYVLGAFKAGADDDEIAESTGLDLEQAAAIRDHFRDQFCAVI